MRYIDEQGTDISAINFNPLRCLRCGNVKEELFGSFISYTLKREIYYCRSCFIFGRVCEKTTMAIRQLQLPKTFRCDFNTQIPCLTDVQQRCVNQMKCYLDEGHKIIDVIAVTGAGKTEMILTIGNEFLKKQKCIAFICPRIDVIRELYERIERYFPEHLIIGWHNGNHARRLGHIYVMTMHQLIHYERFFDLIIIDEADAYPFFTVHEDRMLQYFVMRGLKETGVRIYMTATPKINHGKTVYLMTKFNKRILPTPKFIHISGLSKRLEYHFPMKKMGKFKNGQWLIFVPSIDIGFQVFTYIEKMNKFRAVEFVCSSDSKRIEKIDKFRNQELDILITTSILERGVTFDYISVAIFFPEHQLMSKEMVIQICGRVDRGKVERPYHLEAYYEVYTDKISHIVNQIKEMNKQHEQTV
ncbi:MAG: DEAD/DEAH box helicase family protein [Culicoidibacterales bacterium]